MGFAFHAIHQDPTIYPDPDKFDPDRFSPENCAINAQHFMGFGIGHRACIGKFYLAKDNSFLSYSVHVQFTFEILIF